MIICFILTLCFLLKDAAIFRGLRAIRTMAHSHKERPEKVGMTTKKRVFFLKKEKEARAKRDEQLFLTMGKTRKKYQFLEASGGSKTKSSLSCSA